MLRTVVVVAGLAAGMTTHSAEAAPVDFTFMGVAALGTNGDTTNFSLKFSLDDENKPSYADADIGFVYYDVIYTTAIRGSASYSSTANIGFLSQDQGGGLGFLDSSSDAIARLFGPVLYSGGVEQPVFQLGTFHVTGGFLNPESPLNDPMALLPSQSFDGDITIALSAVPLPASAPMFGAALLGLAGIGYATKRKKAAAAA